LQEEDETMQTNLEIRAAGNPAPARVKILHPAITTGPSMHAEILGLAEKWMQVRVPRLIVVGSTVQVRGGGRVAFGSVRASVAVGPDYDIDVDVERCS
jgi:hypothetical protein